MSKAKIINFELLYSTQGDDLLALASKLIKAEIDSADNCDTIIGLMLIDGFLYKDNELYYMLLGDIQQYAFSKGIKKLVLVVGMCADYQTQLDQRGLKYEIVPWDFNLNLVYQSYKNTPTANWNPQAKKFLFLGGVPSRLNRIVLLSKFYLANALSHAIWSFFPPWTDDDKQWCRKALANMENYEQFLIDCEQSVDDLYTQAKDYSRLTAHELASRDIHNTEWCKNPGYIDPLIFEQTAFSIISEGNAYEPATDYKFLTEKTWRTIINKHPFIFAGEPEQFKYLHSKGLRTFENYLVPYACIENTDTRFNTIVENSKYLLEHIEHLEKLIGLDVEHNYNILLKEIANNQLVLDKLAKDYSLTQIEIDKWFNQKSFVHLANIV
jgi:hypothetical protein